MSVRDIKDNDHFSSELSSAGGQTLVVVSFTATWCYHCKQIKPKFEQLPKKYPQVIFLNVDVDKCKKAARSQSVTSMPTFVFYRNKKEIDRKNGADIVALEGKIKQNIGPYGESVSRFSEDDLYSPPKIPKPTPLRRTPPRPTPPIPTPPRPTPSRNTPSRYTATKPPAPKPAARKLIFDKTKARKLAAYKSVAEKAIVPKTNRKLTNEIINSTQPHQSVQIKLALTDQTIMLQF